MDICVYYVMVYKQKKFHVERRNEASWDSRAVLTSSNFLFRHFGSHENLQVTSDVTKTAIFVLAFPGDKRNMCDITSTMHHLEYTGT